MDHIWSPWRYQYVSAIAQQPGCVFCRMLAEDDDEKNFIVHRGKLNFVVLNIFPYTSGHLMVVPYEHQGELGGLDQAAGSEMLELARRCERAITQEYRPDGFNVGFNLGKCAGAGVAEHLHLHVVPRWCGDANFVSVIGETRNLPEALETTFSRLRKHLH